MISASPERKKHCPKGPDVQDGMDLGQDDHPESYFSWSSLPLIEADYPHFFVRHGRLPAGHRFLLNDPHV